MSWIISKALMDSYENSPSSQGQAAESSQGTYWGGGPSAPSNTSHTPLLYLSSDKMIAFSRLSRSGMTFGLLTDGLGEAVLTLFLAAFPVRTSAQRDGAKASPAQGPGSGRKWHGSFAKFDRATSSWKIPHCLPLAGSMSYSATWPRWGSMRNGACWERPMWERRTNGTGSGFWATPQAHDCHKGNPARVGRYGTKHGGRNLNDEVAKWPTPTVHGDYNRKGASKNSGDGLATAVKLYPTPTSSNTKAVHMRGADRGKKREARSYFPTPQSRDFRTGEGQRWESPERSRNLNDFAALFPTPCAQDAKNSTLPVSQRDRDSIPGYLLSNGESPGGQLNPDWVEWIMGWPIGWTRLGPLNPEIFREWQKAFRIESDGSNVSATARFRRAL